MSKFIQNLKDWRQTGNWGFCPKAWHEHGATPAALRAAAEKKQKDELEWRVLWKNASDLTRLNSTAYERRADEERSKSLAEASETFLTNSAFTHDAGGASTVPAPDGDIGIEDKNIEFFDQVYVFFSHPTDFEVREMVIPVSLEKKFADLSTQTLTRDAMRSYLSRICCYRDLETMQGTTSDSLASYLSSFSMNLHHRPSFNEKSEEGPMGKARPLLADAAALGSAVKQFTKSTTKAVADRFTREARNVREPGTGGEGADRGRTDGDEKAALMLEMMAPHNRDPLLSESVVSSRRGGSSSLPSNASDLGGAGLRLDVRRSDDGKAEAEAEGRGEGRVEDDGDSDDDVMHDLLQTPRASAMGGERGKGLGDRGSPTQAATATLSPPLAEVTDKKSSVEIVSAGASSLPAFYGLGEFLKELDEPCEGLHPCQGRQPCQGGICSSYVAQDSCEKHCVSVLDFMLLVRECFASMLEKCGVYREEFVSATQPDHFYIKVRMKEASLRKLATHIEYDLQCDAGAASSDLWRHSDAHGLPFQTPHLTFTSKAEDATSGWNAAREGRLIWTRYDLLNRPILQMQSFALPTLSYQQSLYSLSTGSKLNMMGLERMDATTKLFVTANSLFRDADRLRLLRYVVEFHFNLINMQEAFLPAFVHKIQVDRATHTLTLAPTKGDPNSDSMHSKGKRLVHLKDGGATAPGISSGGSNLCGCVRGSRTEVPPTLLALYPLHKAQIQRALEEKWANLRLAYTTAQPVDLIRDYFGEEIAFYFVWTAFFTDELKFPALFGALVFLYQFFTAWHQRYNEPVVVSLTAAFAVYMSIWSSRFALNWKKRERLWRERWGMTERKLYHRQERAAFRFDRFVVDAMNPRRLSRYVSARDTQKRRMVSALLVMVTLSAIVMAVVFIYLLRFIIDSLSANLSLSGISGFPGIPGIKGIPGLTTSFDPTLDRQILFLKTYETTIISTIQALQIVLFDVLWCSMVRWLTQYENHRYESEYGKSFTGKMFLFRFVNNFYALLYIGFGRNYIEPCDTVERGGCMSYFQTQLFILYLLLFAFNVVELARPILHFWFLEKKTRFTADKVINPDGSAGSAGSAGSDLREGTPKAGAEDQQALRTKGEVGGENERVNGRAIEREGSAAARLLTKSRTFSSNIGGALETISDLGVLHSGWRNTKGIESQRWMEAYGNDALVEDYMEIVIQYCVVVLFAVALPIVPLFAYLQNVCEIRVDAFKLTKLQRRVFPSSAPEGVATYNDIVTLIGLLAPAVNVALCIFLIPFGSGEMSLKTKLLTFIVTEHFLLIVRIYTQFNSTQANADADTLREGMRLAQHEIQLGNPNRIRFTTTQG